jgi:LPPG:FO 2-phospho-L-lactate transferase
MPEQTQLRGRVVALAGGVGGARLLDGLAAILPPTALTAIVNTGDDFEHWDLLVSPDLDTVMYTLAGLAHPERGWGLTDESFHTLAMIERYGGDAWFQIGDRDLATHLWRSQLLRAGLRLTTVTERLCRALGVSHRVLPMADRPRRTIIETAKGQRLTFQHWLVRERAEPTVRAVRFDGTCEPAPEVIEAILAADLVIICPSNPYVSIDPILALNQVRQALDGRKVVAVSPIVHGRAIKGPLAGMIASLAGRPPSAAAVACHYGGLLSGLVVERGDEGGVEIPVHGTSTVMGGRPGRIRLARDVLAFAESLP